MEYLLIFCAAYFLIGLIVAIPISIIRMTESDNAGIAELPTGLAVILIMSCIWGIVALASISTTETKA